MPYIPSIQKHPHWRPDWLGWIVITIILILLIVIGIWGKARASEVTLTASWYSVESCKREGTSGIMANGRKLNDEKFTCASWDYPFGTILKITNLRSGKCVLAVVTDRGPSKKLYRKGRILDLSKSAFSQIANLKQGLVPVKIEVIKLAKGRER